MYELIIKPEGDLVDTLKWESFADLLTAVARSLDGALVLDLINVNRIASNYIGTIIAAFKEIGDKGSMKVVNVKPRLYELLGILRLTEVLTIEPLA